MKTLSLERIRPKEDEEGLYVSIMGKTCSEIVLIGYGGETESVPANTFPGIEAGQIIRLSPDMEIVKISPSIKSLEATALNNIPQSNANRGSSTRLVLPKQNM